MITFASSYPDFESSADRSGQQPAWKCTWTACQDRTLAVCPKAFVIRDRLAFVHLVVIESVRFPEVDDLIKSAGTGPSREMLAQWLARQRERGRIRIDDPSTAHAC